MMNKIIVGVGLFIVLYAGTASNASAQLTQIGCSRRVIESYPPAESRPVLKLLDEARPAADEFMRLFGAGNLGDFLRRFQKTEVWFNANPKEDGKQVDPASLFQTIGRSVRYENWNQEVLYNMFRREIDPHGTISTSYKIWTDKFGDDEIYAFVETRKDANGQPVITDVIFYGKWAENEFTEQQRREEATMKCERMESGLKLKTD